MKKRSKKISWVNSLKLHRWWYLVFLNIGTFLSMPFFIKFSKKQSNSRWSSIAISSNKLKRNNSINFTIYFLKIANLDQCILDVGDTIFFQAFMNISFVGLFHGGRVSQTAFYYLHLYRKIMVCSRISHNFMVISRFLKNDGYEFYRWNEKWMILHSVELAFLSREYDIGKN